MAVFGKSCWNVGTWKMLRSVLKRYFFGFIKALASKGILNTLKNELHQLWRALTLQLLLSLRDKWDRSLCKFISLEATVINLFAMLRIVLVDLGIWSEFFGCFFEASYEFWRKINICWGKQELARTCRVCVNARRKPNRSKISRG